MELVALRKLFAPLDYVLPACAVVTDDWRRIARHWAYLAWVGASIVVLAYWMFNPEVWSSRSTMALKPIEDVGVIDAAGSSSVGCDAEKFAGKWFTVQWSYLLPIILLVGATAVSSEIDSLDESVLCRGISRRQYFLCKCFARGSAVCLTVALGAAVGMAISALRWSHETTVTGGWIAARETMIVTAAMTWAAVSVGSWFRSPIIAMISTWLIVGGVTLTPMILEIDGVSLDSLTNGIPSMLRLSSLESGPTNWFRASNAWLVFAAFLTVPSMFSFSRRDL